VTLFALAHAGDALAQERPPASDALARERPPVDVSRWELRPYAGWAVIPHSTTGAFFGASVAYRFAAHVSLGVDGTLYAPFNASADHTSKWPLSETAWSTTLDVAYLPWAAPRDANGFDGYFLLGAGVLGTRPIAVVDPTYRSFDYSWTLQGTLGIGARAYLSRHLAVTVELRDRLYFERRENRAVAAGTPNPDAGLGAYQNSPRNPAHWYSPETALTTDVELRLGFSFLGG
jgi:hypothetical protein